MSNSTSDSGTGTGSASSPDVDLLTKETAGFLENWIVQEGLEGLFYGFEFLLALSAIYFLTRRGLRNSLARSLLLCVLLVMFIDSSIVFASGMIWNNVQIKGLSDPSYDPTKTLNDMNVINVILPRITYVLGDIIVVWRAWILFESRSVFRVLLAVCVGISTTVAIVDAVFNLKATDAILKNAHLTFQIMLPVSLLFTNLVATSLIGYKTWYYRKFIHAHIGDANKYSNGFRVEHILIILVESGMVYCLLWILVIITKTSRVFKASLQAGAYVGILMPHVASMYPMMIVLLTALQKTHCDTTLQGLGKTTVSMRFAAAESAPTTATLGGTESGFQGGGQASRDKRFREGVFEDESREKIGREGDYEDDQMV